MSHEKWKPIIQAMFDITDEAKLDFLAQYAEFSAQHKSQFAGEILSTPDTDALMMMVPLELKVLVQLDYQRITLIGSPNEHGVVAKDIVTKVPMHRVLGIAALTQPDYMNLAAATITANLRQMIEKHQHIYLYLVISHYHADKENGNIHYFSRLAV